MANFLSYYPTFRRVIIAFTLEKIAFKLCEAGIQNPWREARLLVAFVSGASYVDVLAIGKCAALTNCNQDKLEEALARRCSREPLTKIIGKARFWKNEFITTSETLDPRPESEIVIEGVLHFFKDRSSSLTFLDIGTGTGCLLLSCLGEYENSIGFGFDINPKAVEIATQNAEQCRLSRRAFFFTRNWNDGISAEALVLPGPRTGAEENFSQQECRVDVANVSRLCSPDIVLCNPPYISTLHKASLDPETSFDPRLSLFGGLDGLAAYRELFSIIRRDISSKATFFFEIGCGQQGDVKEIASENGFTCEAILPDLNAIPRVMVFRRNTGAS
ncbi:MAG: peptide chain release factor N(5)-glutamine methyltransferase [Holosporales bacterium]|jgi:release factor glutamine methyltransferase|nr:peptide chain release factor N(5)-glutamine methyltransferase [Holosporales bacterium]